MSKIKGGAALMKVTLGIVPLALAASVAVRSSVATVPDVTDRTEKRAAAILAERGLEVGRVERTPVPDTGKDRRVIRTDPPRNRFVFKGAHVDLVIGEATPRSIVAGIDPTG